MPNWGDGNTKVLAARARKATAKAEQREQAQKAKEDERWRDSVTEAKLNRKHEEERERQAKAEKKEELRRLTAEEERNAALQPGGRKKQAGSAAKLSRAEIQARMLRAQLGAKKEAEEKQAQSTTEWAFSTENPNRLRAAEAAAAREAGAELVETVEQFIAADGSGQPDRFVTKRMRAAYEAFEAKMFAEFKAENSTLKRSQQKERVWKLWQKSPENPLNQQ